MKLGSIIICILLMAVGPLPLSSCRSESPPRDVEPVEESESPSETESDGESESPPETDPDEGGVFIEPFSEPVKLTPALEATLQKDEEGRPVVTNPASILVLVNKNRNLPADYEPDDLVQPDVPFPFAGDMPRKLLRPEAASALEELVESAEKEELDIYASSGYRSYSTQRNIFEYNARTRGEEEANRFSARPGQSEHQTGLAMDVTCPEVGFELIQRFGETEEGRWIKDNAHRFGFIIRYPEGAEGITGYAYEPWHLRYVGQHHAERIHELGVTFEEYMQGR